MCGGDWARPQTAGSVIEVGQKKKHPKHLKNQKQYLTTPSLENENVIPTALTPTAANKAFQIHPFLVGSHRSSDPIFKEKGEHTCLNI